jgi:hypothetical protein
MPRTHLPQLLRGRNPWSKKAMDLRNICWSVNDSGFAISDIDKPTLLYNKNKACIRWSHSMTFKAARHTELRKNSVFKWVQDKTIFVKHVAGKTNPADIFTKEMCNGAHFHCLGDSFMCCLSNFVTTFLLETHHPRQSSHFLNNLAPLAAWVVLTAGASLSFLALVSNKFCCLVTTMSHLSSLGCIFLGVSIISPPLVLFDVIQFQWLLSFVLSCGIPFGCMDWGCLVCP